MLIKKTDWDRDGKVIFEDFRQAVLDKPLYLETLGECLLTRAAIRTFLATISTTIGNVK